MQKQKKNRKGFTLVELMVVVVIIGILTAIAIPVYNSVTDNAQAKACLANQRTIDSAVMIYKADNNGNIPDSVAALVPQYIAAEPKCALGEAPSYEIADNGLCKTNCGGGEAHQLHTPTELAATVTTATTTTKAP